MEDLLAQERIAEQNVYDLLKPEYSVEALLEALHDFRRSSQACTFTDFANAEKHEARLWRAHTEARKYIHKALSSFRKQADKPVATRHLSRLFLTFIKDSQVFYRGLVLKLNTDFGGIQELEAVAHQVRTEGSGESSSQSITPEVRVQVLQLCYQTLIHLGDLSRYRASEKVDKNPDFGPAFGYYGLACSLRPDSGLGYHQQAVIALEQRDHLRAIHYLYRAMVVKDAHPLAGDNLKLEFEKTNAAWDRGQLIEKGSPQDPQMSKRVLIGWFVRLHSMCFQGEHFRGFVELEREVLSQLSAELKQQRAPGGSLMRMLMVNLAAQYHAGTQFQEHPTLDHQQAFLYFFRINIKTFITFLELFHDSIDPKMNPIPSDEDTPLASKLGPTARRLLPSLRLYSAWLLTNAHLLAGLSSDEFLKPAVDGLWPLYARSIDRIAAVFPIWDLEDQPEVLYMLEEDVETLGFSPLNSEKTNKTWHTKPGGLLKPRFSDRGVRRESEDDEVLSRVKDFLADGLYLANDNDQIPIRLHGTRILFGDEQPQIEEPTLDYRQAVARPPALDTPVPQPTASPRPLSYAAAAANGRALPTVQVKPSNEKVPSVVHSRQAQLSRMVDDLLDEDDANNPITPPQHNVINPAVVISSDMPYTSVHDSAHEISLASSHTHSSKDHGLPNAYNHPASKTPSPVWRTPRNSGIINPAERLHSGSSVWNRSPTGSPHPALGLSTNTLSSPAAMPYRSHSRVNSASSVHSKASQIVGDSWSSVQSFPRPPPVGPLTPGLGADRYTGFGGSGMGSPLLFGAGGGPWSTGPLGSLRNASPPNGQGG